MSDAPTAVCWDDNEPLIPTFEVAQKEFLCMVCGRRYAFLEPKAVKSTPELTARYDELHEKFMSGERPADPGVVSAEPSE
jgi:hypothetical protein